MFTGFTPEAIDFLWGIRLNNNREWFQANKKQYTDKKTCVRNAQKIYSYKMNKEELYDEAC